MVVPSEVPSPDTGTPPSLAETLAVYLKPRVLVIMFLGFSSGLPLALSGSTLLVWMTEAGVNLGTIGLFALVGTPYTIKFLWAPLTDALNVPLLARRFGRRRGWLLLSQFLLIAAIIFLGLCNPSTSPLIVAVGALLVAAASATQDIVVDAFRVESLAESEQAAGMASYVAAYRIGMLVSTAGALFIVSGFQGLGLTHHAAWSAGYAVMAMLVLIGVATTLVAQEPAKSVAAVVTLARESTLQRVMEAAAGAFSEFLTRDMAIAVLAFVVLFKFTDALSGAMTAPFVIELGFSRNEYATIIKGVGLAATLIGGFAQGLANLAFSWQAVLGHDAAWLTFAIIAENFTSAVGTVIFVAYLSALCRNPLHTATQYALLTALAAFGRTYLSSAAGFIAAATGWAWFYAICAVAGLPALALLALLQRRGHFEGFAPAKS